MRQWLEFNIHDRLAMRVDRAAPTAALLADIFEPFLTSGLGRHDLTITGDLEPVHGVAYGENDYEYTDRSLLITETKVQVTSSQGGIRLNGARELLVSAIPLIDWIMVTHGAAMIHAATVDYRGLGICLPAWGGTGKTSTIAKLLRIDGVAFMGDDWAFLSEGGELLGYAKPMFIKPHHRPIYPHLFNEKRKPLLPVRLTRPVGRLTSLVHPFLTQYPRLARVTRKWSPEHMMVRPRDAFPHASMSTAAPLALSIFVERCDGNSAVLQEKCAPWMVSRLLGNFHAEISAFSRDVITALGATGMVPIDQFFKAKAAVLASALAGKPCFLLQVPRALTPDQASDVIVERLHEALSRSRVGVA